MFNAFARTWISVPQLADPMRLLPTTLLCAALVIPAASAIPPAGTAEQPELVDEPGDVTYHPLYLGTQDRLHLDVLAGWMDYDQERDRFGMHFKLADWSELTKRVSGHYLDCNLYGNMTIGGTVVGQVEFLVGKQPRAEELNVRAIFSDERNADLDLDAEVELVFAAPGFAHFSIERERLQMFGEEIRDFNSRCLEANYEAGEVNTYQNVDYAASDGVFNIAEAAPRPAGEMPDQAMLETETSTPVPTERAPAIGLVAALTILGGAAFLMRRR